MPRFAANLTMLFTDVPFLDRFERAGDAGFEAVEFLFPYDHEADEIERRLEDNGLTLVLHNLPAGDWDNGERGIACLPDRVDEFRGGVGRAIEYAQALGVEQVNCLAGRMPVGMDERCRATFVENLSFAAQALKTVGKNLLIEPVNTYDIPGFFLNRTAQAADILKDVGEANCFIQYDLYHAQRMEGELAATLTKYLPQIAHVQLADNPGRHEPGTGEINYAYLFALLDRLGYDGWVGCEYKPSGGTEEGLGWRDELVVPPARMAA